MYTVETKAAYYPQVKLKAWKTPYGLQRTEPSTLYQSSVQGKVIYRFDIFEYLSKYFGDNIVHADRERLYTLVSGECTSIKQYCSILAHCYRRYSAFANWIDFEFYFGDEAIPLQKRLVTKMQLLVEEARAYFNGYGGKFLMEDRGYIYVAFPSDKCPTSDIKGVTDIYV